LSITLLAYAAAGGAGLSLLLLAIEYRAPQAAARCTLAAACGLALLAAGAFLVSGTTDLALAGGLLAAIACAAAMIRLEAPRRLAALVLAPAGLWAALLVASLSVAAGVPYLSKPDVSDVPLDIAIDYHILDEMVAVTDLGRTLTLVAYDDSSSLLEQERGIIGLAQYEHQLIRLADPRTECNCHGWVYTGGRFAIRGRDVEVLLEDNGYALVSQPQAGDVAIYRTQAGEIAHTGLVRLLREDGSIYVESKWGPLGVYLHPLTAQPYGDNIAFYRSPREGHLVQVLPASSISADDGTLASSAIPAIEKANWALHIAPGCASAPAVPERPVMRLPSRRTT
jgi:hypothetical protein